ncbi:LUD domain-containing protein [Streptomyces sp. ME19-01-6]|uniref:LUD domain-containing protein n=1 Tax=Streptomyces sp. ME19-01-6 TaxID=3028686 RepID=UPI0029BD9536|nr:LUD domain-containing protein [Streptomyces sp. ME19-01-6]MDX3231773.1 LUD domain-containing protein [Streptomyces sp. ME19-01-6]
MVVPPGLPQDLLPEGPWSRLEDAPALTVGQLNAVDAVITTGATAIAVTGTVALDHGPGQRRRALTLLPDQIAPDVPETLSLLDPYRPLTLISGPSATSGIEMDRVEKVHGPRILDIVVIVDEWHGAARDRRPVAGGGRSPALSGAAHPSNNIRYIGSILARRDVWPG